MSSDPDVPNYLDPSFIRGLTHARFSRRAALKGAGVLSASAFLAACGVGAKTSTTTTSAHVNWVWDKATKAGTLDFANWPLYIDTGTDAAGKTTYPSLDDFTKQTGIKVNYSEPIQDDASFFA